MLLKGYRVALTKLLVVTVCGYLVTVPLWAIAAPPAVPEPASITLLLIGAGAIAGLGALRNKFK